MSRAIDTMKKALLAKKPKAKPDADSDFLSTGSTLLNLAITGNPFHGFRKGLVYRLVGDSGALKTWLVLTSMAEAVNSPSFKSHRIIYDNGEEGAQMDMPRYFGRRMAERLEAPRTVNGKPKYSGKIEEFYFNVDDALHEDDPFIYGLDSMDSLSSEDETKKFDQLKRFARKDRKKQEEAIESGKEPKGSYGDGKAKKNAANLRRIIDPLREKESILLIISQAKDNIGAGFWEDSKTASGGKSLKFFSSVEIWTSVKRELTKNVRDKKRQIGIVVTCWVRKNRTTGRHRRVDVNFYHSVGIDDIGTLVDWLIEEGHWKETKGIVTAPEFDHTGRKEKLIHKIEEEGRENELRLLAGKVWNEIEEECKIERKPRYV